MSKEIPEDSSSLNILGTGKYRASVQLARVSFLLMVLSLCMNACVFQHNQVIYGIWMAVSGILFGWIGVAGGYIGCIGAYANIFYIIAISSIFFGKIPKKSIVLMIICFIFSLFLREVPNAVASDRIISWGWGAVLWGSSLIILAVSGLVLSGRLHLTKINTFFKIFFAFIITPILTFSIYQHMYASSKEHELYFPFGTAFTVEPLSGIKYVEITEDSALPDNSVVEIIRDFDILRPKDEESNLENYPIYLPDQYQEFGYFWRNYGYYYPEKISGYSRYRKRGNISLLSESKYTDYVYEISNSTRNKIILSVKNKKNNKYLYKQYLVLRERNKKEFYVPGYYDDAVYKLFRKLKLSGIDRNKIKEEVGYDLCKQKRSDSWIDNLYFLDGKMVRFASDDDIERAVFLGSNNYIVKLNIKNSYAQGNSLYEQYICIHF